MFTKLLRIVVAHQFYSILREVSSLPLQTKYSNLKTICHIKPNYFLWAKLPEKVLLAKYVTPVAAILRILLHAGILYRMRYCCIVVFHHLTIRYKMPFKILLYFFFTEIVNFPLMKCFLNNSVNAIHYFWTIAIKLERLKVVHYFWKKEPP